MSYKWRKIANESDRLRVLELSEYSPVAIRIQTATGGEYQYGWTAQHRYFDPAIDEECTAIRAFRRDMEFAELGDLNRIEFIDMDTE